MARPTIEIQDMATGKIVSREMNDKEFAQHEKDFAAYLSSQAEIASKEAQKTSVLERLGITAEEAALLLG